MSDKCNDPRYREMLHNYEMGLLSEAEETEFELHLYSCEYCLKKIEEFRDTARHLKFDPVVREEIGRLAAEETSDEKTPSFFDRFAAATVKSWSPGLKISLVAVAVFVVVMFNLVRIEFGRQETARAAQNSIIVTEFENISGDAGTDRLGEVAMNLLITDLSESPSVHIVSKLHIMEILLYLGLDPKQTVDRQTALRVASETGSNLIVAGSIVQTRPDLVLTVQLIDIRSGVVVASKKTVGEDGEDIFPVIDRLAADIRTELLPRTVVDNEVDCSIADITTHSEEAYYYYIQGLEDDWAFRYPEARKNFRAALEKDSTFAMAYYLMSYFTTGAEQTRMITKALQYSGRCSCKEKYYIRSRQALLMGDTQQAKNELRELLHYYPLERDGLVGLADLENRSGNIDSAVTLYEKVVATYPRSKNAYNDLAYLYSRLGDFEKATEAVNNYIKLAPHEPNPWDSRGEIYARYGHAAEAVGDFKKALEVEPGYGASKRHLVMIYLQEQKYDSARVLINEMMNDDEELNVSYAFFQQALLNVWRGQFNEALAVLDKGIERDMGTRYRILAVQKHWQKAMILQETGRFDDALREVSRCLNLNHLLNPNDKLGYSHYNGQLLAEAGRYNDARQVADNIRKDLGETKEADFGYYYVKGCLALEEMKPDEALEYFAKASALNPSQPLVYLTARAYLAAGNPEKTIELLEADRRSYNSDRLEWSAADIKSLYYLGQAYEQTGDVGRAAQSYELLLRIWSGADAVPAELDDARARLTRLKS